MENTSSPREDTPMDDSYPKPIIIHFNNKRVISSDDIIKENSEYLASILEGDNDLTLITITNELFEDPNVMRAIEIVLKIGQVQIKDPKTCFISLYRAADFLGCTKILDYLKALFRNNPKLREDLFADGTAFDKLADHLIRSLLDVESSDFESAKVDMKILLRYLEWKGVEPWHVELLKKCLEEMDRSKKEKKRPRRYHPDVDISDDDFGPDPPRSIPRAVPRGRKPSRSTFRSHFARTRNSNGDSESSEFVPTSFSSRGRGRSYANWRNEKVKKDIEDVNDQILQQIMEESKAAFEKWEKVNKELEEANDRIVQQIMEESKADVEKDRKNEKDQDDEEKSS